MSFFRMNEEEKNLVERDYEGEIRAKIMTEINKRFNEMETRMISKIEAVDSKIAIVDSELKSLRANLYDKFNPGWYDVALKREEEQIKYEQEHIKKYQSLLKTTQEYLIDYRNLTLNQIDHHKDTITECQNQIKYAEAHIKEITEKREHSKQRYW